MDANLSKPVAPRASAALCPSGSSAADHGVAPPPRSSQPDSPAAPPVASPQAIVSANAFVLIGEAVPAHSADNSGEACDRAALDELRAEGGTLLAELAGIFQAEVANGLNRLAGALEARDCAAAARVAHTLRGSAGIFGAAQMQEVAAQIDQAARAGRAAEAAAMIGKFRLECERVRRCLAAAIKA